EQIGDERAIDLERVERELAEVAERRVAGPEIVERDPEPHRLERAEQRARRLRVVDERALRDLDLERARVDARLFHDALHVVVEMRIAELPGGDVHREAHGAEAAHALPLAELVAGLADDPAADPDDEAGLLRDRDELGRRDEAALRVAPAE